MTANPIPAWAVVGAKVVIEPGTAGRTRRFYQSTITRVTKTSVFTKSTAPAARERRFVPTSYKMHGDRMVEYGNRQNTWTHDTYLWNPDAPEVIEALEQAARYAAEDALAAACNECERAMNKGGAEEKAATVAMLETVLARYREATK